MEAMRLQYKLPIQLHGNQQKVHESRARFKVLKIGKRWGKSYWAGYEIVQMAFTNPGVYWYIAPTIGQAREIMWDFLKGIIPQELMIGNPLNTDLEINLNLFDRGYSKIKLKGTDNETSLRGAALSGGIMDEAAYDETKGYAWPNILRGQLAKSKGPFYFISSPHKDGKNWFTKLCEMAQARERAGDKDWAYWHDTIYGNPMLDKTEIEDIKSGCTDDKWRLEYLAEESDYGGLLLSEFDYGKHVKEFELPKDVIFVRGIDWGISHPTTCLWLAIDLKDQFAYVLDEYYATGKLIHESAGMIKKMSAGKSIAWTVIDPSTAKRNSQTGLTDMWEFQRNGVPCIAGDNRDRGYDIMKMFFKKEKILIHPKCKNLIAEAKNYVIGDEEGDDCLDPCFVAGTKIICRDKEKNIENVTENDSVLTRKGFRKVKANSMTSEFSEVYKLQTNVGSLIGTFNHPFFMKDGTVKKLGELKENDKLVDMRYQILIQYGIWKLKSYLKPFKNLTESDSIEWVKNTSKNVLRTAERLYYCTGKFGNIILERFFLDITFIIRIITRQIIKFQILNYCHLMSIGNITQDCQRIENECEDICSQFVILWRKSGMGVRKAESFTNVSENYLGKINLSLKRIAKFAGENIKLHFLQGLNFVIQIVVKLISRDVKVTSVTRLSTKQPVFNLSIEEVPEYIANGILVHNCRYALVRIHDTVFHGNLGFTEEKPKVRAPNTFNFNDPMFGQRMNNPKDLSWAYAEDYSEVA